MFAKIKVNKDFRDVLRYNEKKVEKDKAECLGAGNFIKDLTELTQKDKLYHFHRLISLNENVSRKCLHITLNFHPSDKLSEGILSQIAHDYLREMKLGQQPYLIYRHLDAAHPHLHLLTTNIQKDGSRLNLSLQDFYHSKKLIREMEQFHHLEVSGRKKGERQFLQQSMKIKYGEVSTMPAISQVLDKVVPHYKYISLEELNVLLRLYNVDAYRGKESSRLYHYRGLLYRVLGEDGRPTGSQIKASLFESKPILKKLERQFALNLSESRRQEHEQHIKTAIDWALAQQKLDLPGLQRILQGQRISMVRSGLKLFYVDHQNRSIFDAAQLGEKYTEKGLQQRCAPTLSLGQQQPLQKQLQKERGREEPSIEQ